jgi:hypothetical protein
MAHMNQIRIRSLFPKADEDDVPEIIDTDTVHQPLRGPRLRVSYDCAVPEVPIVPNSAARSPDRGHRIALHLSSVDDPPKPTADNEDQKDKPAQAEMQMGAP